MRPTDRAHPFWEFQKGYRTINLAIFTELSEVTFIMYIPFIPSVGIEASPLQFNSATFAPFRL